MAILILVDKVGSSYLLLTKMTDFQKKNLIVAPIVVASHSVIVAFILPMVEWSA